MAMFWIVVLETTNSGSCWYGGHNFGAAARKRRRFSEMTRSLAAEGNDTAGFEDRSFHDVAGIDRDAETST
ncbi:hypothetical protein CQ13_37415 [Bradyrhizobium retamae]|uniref:Uncharacterized protein n=1 Tax=Bradyrhizobium retamae TaxID=1300035 RepID=A0A0R3M544_9BRAD|nr:hypothetical protein CQ13_37415 [Bradyrhizobium retamae]